MGFSPRLRRQAVRLRFAGVILFCIVLLTLLLVSALLPRTWTARVVLEIPQDRFRNSDPAGELEQVFRVAEKLIAEDGVRLLIEEAAGGMEVRLSSHSSDSAYEQLNLVLSAAAHERWERRRQYLLDTVAEREKEAADAAATLTDASARLEAYRIATLEGGESALTAELATRKSKLDLGTIQIREAQDTRARVLGDLQRLQDRLSALQPELELEGPVLKRIAALRAELASARASGSEGRAHTEELERAISQLDVDLRALAERRRRAESERDLRVLPEMGSVEIHLAAIDRRLGELSMARDGMMAEFDALQAELELRNRSDERLRSLERGFADAHARDRRCKQSLQQARDASVVAAYPSNRPLKLLSRPVPPPRPDGPHPLTFAVVSMLGAAVVVCGVFGLVVIARPEGSVEMTPASDAVVRPSAILAAVLAVISAFCAVFFVVAMV